MADIDLSDGRLGPRLTQQCVRGDDIVVQHKIGIAGDEGFETRRLLPVSYSEGSVIKQQAAVAKAPRARRV